MTIDLTPRPGAASPLARVAAHARMEVALTLRNGEQLLLALVIPVALLVAGRLFGPRIGASPDDVVPGVFALALWSTGFTSLAIMTAFERRAGVLERLAATPLGKGGLILGKATAVVAIAGLQVAVLAVIALLLGWQPAGSPLSGALALVASLLALLAFASLGLLLAARLRAEATLGLANLIYLIGLATGLLVPTGVFPAGVQPYLALLPTAALGEQLRAWSGGGPLTATPLIVLAVWAAGATLVTRKAFQWTS